MVNIVDEVYLVVPIEDKLIIETLLAMLMTFNSKGIEQFDELVCALTGMYSYSYALNDFDLDLNNRLTLPVKPSI